MFEELALAKADASYGRLLRPRASNCRENYRVSLCCV
jgi:hypothetical protein